MQSDQQQRIMGYFIEEAKEHLSTIERGLLTLQSTIDDPEGIQELFRAAHSVKGGAAMLGLDSIQKIAHRLEDYFKVLQEHPIQVDQTLESLFLKGFDALSELLEELQSPLGLTEDNVQRVTATVEPVLISLGQHLDQLVAESTTGLPRPAAPSTRRPPTTAPLVVERPASPPDDSALQLIFRSDVPTRLREMLQLFKQPEHSAPARQQLSDICRSLEQAGEQFGLRAWCDLIRAVSQAIANPNNSHRALASIVIREVKQAQELVLAGHADAIVISAALQELLPPEVSRVPPSEDDLHNWLATVEADQSVLTSLGLDALPEVAAPPLTEVTPTPVLDEPLNAAAQESQTKMGPQVGMAELNSLADLFEGEVPDLDLTWEEEVLGFQDEATSGLDGTELPSDLSDLLADVAETQPKRALVTEDLDFLDFLGDSDSAATPASPAADHPSEAHPRARSSEAELFGTADFDAASFDDLLAIYDTDTQTADAVSPEQDRGTEDTSLDEFEGLLAELDAPPPAAVAKPPTTDPALSGLEAMFEDLAGAEPELFGEIETAEEPTVPPPVASAAAEDWDFDLGVDFAPVAETAAIAQAAELATPSPRDAQARDKNVDRDAETADADLDALLAMTLTEAEGAGAITETVDLDAGLDDLLDAIAAEADQSPGEVHRTAPLTEAQGEAEAIDILDFAEPEATAPTPAPTSETGATEASRGSVTAEVTAAVESVAVPPAQRQPMTDPWEVMFGDEERALTAVADTDLGTDLGTDLDATHPVASDRRVPTTDTLSDPTEDTLTDSNEASTAEEPVSSPPISTAPISTAIPAQWAEEIDEFFEVAPASAAIASPSPEAVSPAAPTAIPEPGMAADQAHPWPERAPSDELNGELGEFLAPEVEAHGDLFATDAREAALEAMALEADALRDLAGVGESEAGLGELAERFGDSQSSEQPEADLDALEADLDALEADLSDLDNLGVDTDLGNPESVAELETELGDLDNLAELETGLGDLDNLGDLESDFGNPESFGPLEADLGALETGLGDLDNLAALETGLGELEAGLSELGGDLSDLAGLGELETGTSATEGQPPPEVPIASPQPLSQALETPSAPAMPSVTVEDFPDHLFDDLTSEEELELAEIAIEPSDVVEESGDLAATLGLEQIDLLAEAEETAVPVDVDFADLDQELESLALNALDLAESGEDTTAAAAIAGPEPDLAGLGDLDELDALLEEEVPASAIAPETQDFADLDRLLELQEPSPHPSEAVTSPTEDTASFNELESLLDKGTREPQPAPSAPPTRATKAEDDEFDDLEKLLKAADETLGGPAVAANRVQTPIGRRRAMVEQTMRVPVKQLDGLSNLVGELVVSRNSLEQNQERLRQFLDNLLYQVQQLSDVGQRMRDLYERSLLEASLLSHRQSHAAPTTGGHAATNGGGDSHLTGVNFDALEMDRFTAFHTLSQEMIELIVRVRESASDIEFTGDETDQITRQFRQITTQLQESLTRSRMVPFAQAADRLPRAVRDISLKCGKQADLHVEGRDTLIDKMILEQLYDPLTHLVNNAITHGIETPAERIAAGKEPKGRISIRAFHTGNQTVIAIADDGAGIDADRVKRKAVEKGLITPQEAQTMSRLDAYDLLFLPGFSTKDKADDFAGRGVGMDVVRTSLTEIRGAINTDSTLGKGTTFTIRLPLTLSISKALLCLSNRTRIAFPMDGVEDMLDVPRDRVQTNEDGQTCILWRDTLLPFRPLADLLKYNRQMGRGSIYGGATLDDDIISVVVLRSASNFVALQVDQVEGEREIVIKQLEGPVPKPIGIAGATVMGDGRIMPIADVLELIDLAMGRMRGGNSSMWEQQPAPPPIEEATTAEPTVLIVDDSITVRELLSMTFTKAGYRVEQARDGQEAWEKLRSGLPCDLVFCDIEMPRMDGLELLSRLQKDPHLSQIPIAMLTSRGADRHRQMAIQLGASGYFTKPYLEEALLDAASRMLKGEVLVGAGA